MDEQSKPSADDPAPAPAAPEVAVEAANTEVEAEILIADVEEAQATDAEAEAADTEAQTAEDPPAANADEAPADEDPPADDEADPESAEILAAGIAGQGQGKPGRKAGQGGGGRNKGNGRNKGGGRNKGNGRNKGGGRKNKNSMQAQVEAATIIETLPVAGNARMKPRHWVAVASFVLLVMLPASVTFWYLETQAADQFASTVGFTVRKEDSSSSTDVLSGISALSSGSSSDTDILYEFIQSQDLVARVNRRLDLHVLYSKPKTDPIYAFDPTGSIEDLVKYWGNMVYISYDGASGLIQLRVHAFTPKDAQLIAQVIFDESTKMINHLSSIAREDATRYAEEDLARAVSRLKTARQAITEFRITERIVDPNADIQSQMGLLGTLQQQLAAAMIELDLMNDSTRPGVQDPRLDQASRKIAVIQARIAEERKKFGVGDDNSGDDYATLVSQYEGLIVEREFAESSYLSALAAFESSKAEAQRQSRYLAAYVTPTLAEKAQYPQRLTIFGLVTLFLTLAWAIMILVAYSIKDRR